MEGFVGQLYHVFWYALIRISWVLKVLVEAGDTFVVRRHVRAQPPTFPGFIASVIKRCITCITLQNGLGDTFLPASALVEHLLANSTGLGHLLPALLGQKCSLQRFAHNGLRRTRQKPSTVGMVSISLRVSMEIGGRRCL